MKEIKFDVNNMAQVELTEDGKKTLEHFLKRFVGEGPDDLKLDGQGILRRPFWQIMVIFGSSFGLGRGLIFVNNQIQVEVPNDDT